MLHRTLSISFISQYPFSEASENEARVNMKRSGGSIKCGWLHVRNYLVLLLPYFVYKSLSSCVQK